MYKTKNNTIYIYKAKTMGKFIKVINTENTLNNDNLNHYRAQPNNGPTVYCFKNTETDETQLAIISNSHLGHDTDYDTNFTWRVEIKNNITYVFFTFTKISDYLLNNNYIICIETLSCGKNRTLNVYKKDDNGDVSLWQKNEDKTWMYINNITLNEEYCLQVTVDKNIGPFRVKKKQLDKPNWYLHPYIRPSIRSAGATNGSYTNYISLPTYKKIDMPSINYKNELIRTK